LIVHELDLPSPEGLGAICAPRGCTYRLAEMDTASFRTWRPPYRRDAPAVAAQETCWGA